MLMDNLNDQILKLAGPNILSNISIPLLSAVDVALMGHLSILHLGAIGLATMIFNFFFWNFGFLRMGTTGMVAQAYGAQDLKKIGSLLFSALMSALTIALVILVLQTPILQLAELLLDIGDDHVPYVGQYFKIRIWAAPASLMTYCLIGWLLGLQDAISPLIATVIINGVNILLTWIMVIHYGWGIEGAAWGTLISEYLGVIILFIIVMRREDKSSFFSWDQSVWRGFIANNIDLFIRTVALTSAFAIFYRMSSMSGELILATNVILLQYLSWVSYGIDGFAFAAESVIGKYFGRRDVQALERAILLSFRWAVTLALLIGVVFFIGWEWFSGIFTDKYEIILLLKSFRGWMLILPLITCFCYIWDGIFIGLTETRIMRNTMLLSLLLLVFSIWLLHDTLSNAIWYCFMIFLVSRGALLWIIWRRNKRKLLYNDLLIN